MAIMAMKQKQKRRPARLKRVAGNPNRRKGKKPSGHSSMTTAYQGGGSFRDY